ncbi:MAG: YihY/virulence factor BrkB family protein [Erysipelotrichaceae bacterium]|uniref:YihY/virulence factor BrkB family protein n=1 Tax=Floccifex sp. TaxID=2815810 RepID=UPI002A76173F|nr:YihY/virulence factor BrkB family protein [Floccifex sp.]MDD7281315.1 YihY/virulence factor BrkB family protein [Erysipelotrichaceae bacterium]MDY2958304.1 YihY/virulence factor BrkB family protein [Floccifex sp.]
MKKATIDFIEQYTKRFPAKYKEDQISLYATQTAFFLIISAVPFAMILLTLLKTFLPLEQSTFIFTALEGLPDTIRRYVFVFLEDIEAQPSLSITSINTITCLYAASKSTYALTQGLNAIHKIEDKRNYVRIRLQSIFNTLLLMLLIVFSLLILVYGGKITVFLQKYYPKFLLDIFELLNINQIITYAIITILICGLYVILPGKHLNFFYQIPGAVCTTISWVLFSNIFSFMIDHSSRFSFTYGVLSNIVFIMIWLQWCITFFLIFAQINAFIERFIKKLIENRKNKQA